MSKRAERLTKRKKEWDLAKKMWDKCEMKSSKSGKKANGGKEDKQNIPLRRSTRLK